jgi:hypothetical protein
MTFSLDRTYGDQKYRLTFYDIPGLGGQLIAVSLLYLGLAHSSPR